MNVQAILGWIKSNLVIVICVLVIIAAPIGLTWYTSGMNAEVREQVETRAKKKDELASLERTPIAEDMGLVNERLLAEYREVVNANREDADRVLERALAHNRQGRGVLMPQLFPDPPFDQRETIPQDFHERLIEAYSELLESVDAGQPPSAAELLPELNRRREVFIAQELAKNATDDLMQEEQERLNRMLTDLRIGRYVEAAESIGLYASTSAMDLPEWDQTRLPTLEEMWEWQWEYWTDEDILKALAGANGDAESVIVAPVKRVVRLDSQRLGASSGGGGNASSGGASRGGGMMGAGGGRRNPGSRGAASGGGGSAGAAPKGQKIDPAKPAPTNYNASFTGRVSNPLYDVRQVDLEIIVETARIPDVLDALAKQNFITVLNVEMAPANPHADIAQGYFYGNEPLSTLNLTLETVWLRQWTKEFMPDEVKIALGVPVENDQPAG